MQMKHDDRLQDLKQVLEKARVECGVPGVSVAVQHKGQLIFAEGLGIRNESKEPFLPETLMPIASITKAFTAAAIGELVAEGKMDWEKTPVSAYLPEFQLQDPVLTSELTMTDLLSHRTRIPNLDIAWYRTKTPRRELIKRLRHIKMSPKLNTKMNYSNIMYAVAGEAAANVSGMTLEQLVETKVLQPLGLTNTGFGQLEMKAKSDNYAMPFMAESFEDAQKGNFKMGYLDPIYMADAPAGDMYSNVLDLLQWGRTILDQGELKGKQVLHKENVNELLTAKTLADTTRRYPEFSPVSAYGMGWFIDSYKGHIVYRHTGSALGYVSNLVLFPDDELVIAIFANVNTTMFQSIAPYYIADKLLDLPETKAWLTDVAVEQTKKRYEWLAEDVRGKIPERLKNRPGSHRLEDCIGKYTHPVYGEVFIELESGDHVVSNVQIEGEGTKVGTAKSLVFKMNEFNDKLEHYHYDSFRVQLQGFALSLGFLVTFSTGADGKVDGFDIVLAKEKQHFLKADEKAA
ncbi:hypothetical protein BX616_004552 [Lobosporangium transversale]|uniref:Beta-lactamase/transpeptidase-like protein n=1 Tax=Lobosporangium transversale TaxID=64571 RepID=A0A1Y2GWY2_9FUNG|nr:beta-lactamase/transpeptidase-like protein [Lobosporangium transversale]KAF9898056.1 hypothetical protein BX616_004552 [Lobosporangium transversale]ORZ21857.1 beta-lactamase/transpeptidase-like protein [Lobosporangium transversale]|eukprot:XP_021883108.1 beta-lactamase/transpeptidase-like protein [Lobosporangium transversale]